MVLQIGKIGKLEVHYLANVVPIGSELEMQSLISDIKKNGQLQDIVLYKGKIIDGRRRATACDKIGIDPKTKEIDPNLSEDEVMEMVLSLNNRRNLSPAQKAMIAAIQVSVNAHQRAGYTKATEYAKYAWGVPKSTYDLARYVLKYDPKTSERIFETGFGIVIHGRPETLKSAYKRLKWAEKIKKNDTWIDIGDETLKQICKKLDAEFTGKTREDVIVALAKCIKSKQEEKEKLNF